MISKSTLGAIAVVAAIGFGSPAFAQANNPNNNPTFSPGTTGGGSAGYNRQATTPNWRLKAHHHHHHVSSATKS